MKKSELKHLIKEVYIILQEWRGMTSGEWVEPNGIVHDVGNETHWVWADVYLKGDRRFKDDPKEELLARGWMRVMYSANEYLICIEVRKMTKQQKNYIEDQSEETEWAIMDDDGSIIYKPFYCKTSDRFLQEDHGMGYSHNVELPQEPNKMPRDPLNDPLLTGKLNETYKFKDFNWLGNMAGFNVPSDVYNDTVLLGVIESRPDGYIIKSIMGPVRIEPVSLTPSNKFKTKLDAAKMLHTLWKHYRKLQKP